ncbi:AAA family ATPase [Luteimonas yindakuii]
MARCARAARVERGPGPATRRRQPSRLTMPRPVLYVLAGVNGAGKSSIGGHLLQRAGLTWFNPDEFARELAQRTGCAVDDANAAAWQEGMRRLDAALAAGHDHAFETTLGGTTVSLRIAQAARSHDVLMWYCGLSSPEQHIARVQARVAAGGHDIPEAMIRARWTRARENLVALMPRLARLRVYDNSTDVAPGAVIPDPTLVLEMAAGRTVRPRPDHLEDLAATPEWARPLVEAALQRGL